MKYKATMKIITCLSLILFLSNNSESRKKRTIELDDFSQKIVNMIVNDDVEGLSKYFFDKVSVVESPMLGIVFKKENKYDGYLERNGFLYNVIFNSKELRNGLKSKISEDDPSNYSSFKEVFMNSDEIISVMDGDVSQIASYLGNKNYNVYFKKISSGYLIAGFEFSNKEW